MSTDRAYNLLYLEPFVAPFDLSRKREVDEPNILMLQNSNQKPPWRGDLLYSDYQLVYKLNFAS